MTAFALVSDAGIEIEKPQHFTGKGKITYPNGDTYEGDFVKGSREGQGVYHYSLAQASYEGQFVGGLRDGCGILRYADGSKYVGSFKKGEREGEGQMYYDNGDVYSGDFVGGAKQGKGIYIKESAVEELDGVWERGEFRRGQWTVGKGRGEYGEAIFSGEWLEGYPFGEGSWVLPSRAIRHARACGVLKEPLSAAGEANGKYEQRLFGDKIALQWKCARDAGKV